MVNVRVGEDDLLNVAVKYNAFRLCLEKELCPGLDLDHV